MKMREYQQEAAKTCPKAADINYYALKLAAECGEVIDLIAKHLHQGKQLERSMVREEGGDVLWALSNLMRICGIDMQDVAEVNLHKIAKRYPGTGVLEIIRQSPNEDR